MTAYDSDFYAKIRYGARNSARVVVPRITELVGCRSVVDIGCGDGTWLSVFRENGVARVLGVDGGQMSPEWLQIPREDFLPHDLSTPLSIEARFDLAMSLEAAEHLPHSAAAPLVGVLTSLAPVVLFSAAVPYQGGTGHVNEQWPAYWVDLFALRGFVAIDCMRSEIWNDARIEWWYRQNMVVFVHEPALARYPRLVEARERSPREVLPLVHPVAYEWKHLYSRPS